MRSRSQYQFKADFVKAALIDETIGNLHVSDLEVLHRQEHLLAKEEAAEFYNQYESSDHFEVATD